MWISSEEVAEETQWLFARNYRDGKVTVAQVDAVRAVVGEIAVKFEADRDRLRAYVKAAPLRHCTGWLPTADCDLLSSIEQAVKRQKTTTVHLRFPKIAAILVALEDLRRREARR